MTMSFPNFPAWRYGPNGASVIVNSEDETPKGYVDHPSKVKNAAAPAKTPEKVPEKQPDAADVDAAGTAFDPALHAATKSKTKAGLWRMKVGVARPAPLDL
jgi:hypothetical protein